MCSIDQLEVLLTSDRNERVNISEDEADIPPRNIVLESKYSVETGVNEQFRTVLLNHLIQFRTIYQVNEFTIFHAYKILEPVITKLSILRQDLEKYALSCLFISMKCRWIY